MNIWQRNLSTASRSKLYLIVASVSLILFFYSVRQIGYVIVEPSDLFGLVSHLTLSYWIGLALLLACSVFTFLDKESKSDVVYLSLLFVLGLYLFGIASLIQENVRHPELYGHLGQVRTLLATGHIEIAEATNIESYRAWPAVYFLYAPILQVTGISLESWIHYTPWFWLICFIFITYAIGKRFELSPNLCFLLTFLAISSFWLLQSDGSQQGIAVLLYLVCLIMLAIPRPYNEVAEVIPPILCFAALILTHSLTALAVLAAVIALSIYRKARGQGTPFVFLFPVFFLTWYMYQAYQAFEQGILRWWAAPWDYILRMGMKVEGIYAPTHTFPTALITHYSQLAYVFIFGICTVATVIYLFAGKVKEDDRKWVIFTLIWLVGIGLCGFLWITRETWYRLYLFGLVPVIYVVLKVLPARKLLITLMLLCLVFLLPARYGTECYHGQNLSSELAGMRFFSYQVDLPTGYFFYNQGDTVLRLFYNPEILNWSHVGTAGLKQLPSGEFVFFESRWEKPLASTLDEAKYVLTGKQGRLTEIARYGEEVIISIWMQTGNGEKADLIYNNGDFQIYKRYEPNR